MIVKNNLGKVRAQRDLKQAEIAKQAGMPQSTYSLLETGRALPSVDELNAICAAFHLKPDQIYGDQLLAAVYGLEGRERPEPKKRTFFSVKIPLELAPDIDRGMQGNGYANRTEYVVETVRQRVMKERA